MFSSDLYFSYVLELERVVYFGALKKRNNVFAPYTLELKEAEAERRRKNLKTFSLDLLGRRVMTNLSEGVEGTASSGGECSAKKDVCVEVADEAKLIQSVGTTTLELHGDGSRASAEPLTVKVEELSSRRVVANPSIEHSPLFLNSELVSKPLVEKHKSSFMKRGGVDSGVSGGQVPGTDGGFTIAPAKVKAGISVAKSQTGLGSGRRRVLDESPFDRVSIEEVTATTHAAAMEGILALSRAAGPIDICQPRNEPSSSNINHPFNLIRPSPYLSVDTNQRNKLEVLLPGLVILRSYLTMEMQKQIVLTVRDLGKGLGGFYTPSYRDGAELKLAMMCMGLHWEPRLGTYQRARTEHDGAIPPRIPAKLLCLADQALADVSKILENRKLKPFPPAQFDICLANFYRPGSGRLGLHQDKSESHDSLRRGVPVVSLSIGDAADFHYSKAGPDWETSSKVRLESGDLLVFGGASRMVFHGISYVHAGTGPSELRDEPVNMLPGRVNLTFRES